MSGPAVTTADGAVPAGWFDSIGTWGGWLQGALSESRTALGERGLAIDFSTLLTSDPGPSE